MTSDLTVPTTPTSPADLGRPPRLRLLVGAACAPAMLLALLATGPLDPFDDGASPAAQLRQVTGHESLIGPLDGWRSSRRCSARGWCCRSPGSHAAAAAGWATPER